MLHGRDPWDVGVGVGCALGAGILCLLLGAPGLGVALIGGCVLFGFWARSATRVPTPEQAEDAPLAPVIALAPRRQTPWERLAQAGELRAEGRFEAAEVLYRELASAEPPAIAAAATLGLGVVLASQGDAEGAETALREAVERDEGFAAPAQSWLAMVRRIAG